MDFLNRPPRRRIKGTGGGCKLQAQAVLLVVVGFLGSLVWSLWSVKDMLL